MRFEMAPGVDAIADRTNRSPWGGAGMLGGRYSHPTEDGRAKIMNEPAIVQISVLAPLTYEVVARTVSKEDGTWQVLYLNPDLQFTVIGCDLEQRVNSAIQDWVQPAPMEP